MIKKPDIAKINLFNVTGNKKFKSIEVCKNIAKIKEKRIKIAGKKK